MIWLLIYGIKEMTVAVVPLQEKPYLLTLWASTKSSVLVVYTFIYEGVAKWSETNAVVKVKGAWQSRGSCGNGQHTVRQKVLAIAQLDFAGDNSITVKKLVTFP